MDLFMENSGFSHIGEKILKLLDFETASTCRSVNKSWKIWVENYSRPNGPEDLHLMAFSGETYILVPFRNGFTKMLKNSGRVRTARNQVNLLPLERPDDEMWAALLTHVHFKLKSTWIDIAFKN